MKCGAIWKPKLKVCATKENYIIRNGIICRGLCAPSYLIRTYAVSSKVPLIRGVRRLKYQNSAYLTPLTPLIKGECVSPVIFTLAMLGNLASASVCGLLFIEM